MMINPKVSSVYVIDSKKERRYIKQILRFIRKKKLPKRLEVSITEEVLKVLEESSEHEYNKKYDVFNSQHETEFRRTRITDIIAEINKISKIGNISVKF